MFPVNGCASSGSLDLDKNSSVCCLVSLATIGRDAALEKRRKINVLLFYTVGNILASPAWLLYIRILGTHYKEEEEEKKNPFSFIFIWLGDCNCSFLFLRRIDSHTSSLPWQLSSGHLSGHCLLWFTLSGSLLPIA